MHLTGRSIRTRQHHNPALGALIATLGVLALVAAVTAWLLWGSMPRINALRDAELAGDAAAGTRFARLHRASVSVNMVQLAAVLFALVRVALEMQ